MTFEEIECISNVNPSLTNNVREKNFYLGKENLSSKDLLDVYFSEQSTIYKNELIEFSTLNPKIASNVEAFVFIPCYNENTNLSNIIELYKKQTFKNYVICFVINFAKRKNYANDYEKFVNAINFLILEQKKNENIHIVAKQFEDNAFGLGRARKYGLDYCLHQIKSLSNNQINQTFIVSNEGDMLYIDVTYLSKYKKLFEIDPYKFIQGKIDYPSFIKDVPYLNIYTSTKELVHLGQGLNTHDFPHFGGLMPIGRNFAIHPRIAVLAGGIDPTFNIGTDDDIKLGNDIKYILGAKYKINDAVSVITNPRREVFLVFDVLSGNDNDAKKMYEEFHEIKFIYDMSISEIEEKAKKINEHNFDKSLLPKFLNHFFQWVHLTVSKNYFEENIEFVEIQRKYDAHELGYWEAENEFARLFIELSFNNILLISEINNRALELFNKLIKPCGLEFKKVSDSMRCSLIE